MFLVMMVMAFLVYGNALRGGFVLEDFDFIANNQYVKSWRYLPQIFTREVGAGSGTRYTYYRPMHIFSYLIEYTLWGTDVRGYHITNILLHGLISFLFYRLVFILFANRILSAAMAALFLVHPIHNAVVAHIAGRENLLGALFLLVAFIVYIRISRESHLILYPVLLVAWAGALLSKENNLMFPALLILYHVVFKQRIRLAPWIGIITILGFYFGLRTVIGESVPFKTLDWVSVWARVPGTFVALTQYFQLLISPTQIHRIYENDVFFVFHPQAVLGFILAAGFLIYAFCKRHSNPSLAFAVFWFFILYVPVSNLYPLNAYLAEHRMYLASLGFFLIVAKSLCGLSQKRKMRPAVSAVFILLILSHSVFTYIANGYWRSHEVFVENNYRMNPHSALTLNAYGCLKYRRNENKQAIAMFVKAIKTRPAYVDAYINLGATLRKVGKHQAAIRILRTAIMLDPSKAAAFHNLATVYTDRQQYRRAEELFLEALALNPYQIHVYYNLGRISFLSGEFEKAVGYFEKAIELDPRDSKAWLFLCRIHRWMGRKDLADNYCDRYIRLMFPHFSVQDAQKIKEQLDARP